MKKCKLVVSGTVEPDADCVLLQNETEVILEPKMRNQSQPIPIEQPISKSVSKIQDAPFLPSIDSINIDEEPRFTSTDSDLSLKEFNGMGLRVNDDRKRRERSPYNASTISSQWQGLMKFFGFKTLLQDRGAYDSEESEGEYDEDDSIDQSDPLLQNGLNLVLRTQPMKYNVTEKDYDTSPVAITRSRSGSNSPRKRSSKSGSSSPRKGSREMLTASEPKSSFQLNFVPQQINTVYIDRSDVESQFKCSRQDIPCVFIAKLYKLLSPKEQLQEKRNQSTGNGKTSPRKAGNATEKDKTPGDIDSPDTPAGPSETKATNADNLSCIVRVVVMDKRRQNCNDLFSPIMGRILEEQPLVAGHVIIPDMLRRYLKLDISSKVWLQILKGGLTRASAFVVYLSGNRPKILSNDKLTLAFRQWLDQISSEDYPMIIFQGMFVKFPVFPEQYVECQITYSEADPAHKGSYTMLHPGVLRSASLNFVSSGRMHELNHPAIQPMLAYTSIAGIDPQLQEIDKENLG